MPKVKIRGTAVTWVLYHDIPHKKLQDLIRFKDEFVFNGKQITVTTITKYIKFEKKGRDNPL